MIILQDIIKRFASTIIPVVLLAAQANAQMGVGARSPANSAEIVTNAGNVIVDNTGKVGVLVASPKVAIDLRSGSNGSVAIGMTDKTAIAAGSGAVRYNPSPAIGVKGYLEFSDGANWIGLYPKGKPRIVVMARKTTQNTEVFEGPDSGPKSGVMQRRSSYLTNWTKILDSDSGIDAENFNPATGEFVAPRDGVYFATFTFALQTANVNTGSNNQTEAIWQVKDGITDAIIQRVKTNNGYASDTGAGASNTVPVGSACTVSVKLKKGDKLRPFTWISVQFDGVNSLFNTDASYNVLTIVEQ